MIKMAKITILVVCVYLIASGPVLAGRLEGTIKRNGIPVGEGVIVQVKTAAEKPYEAKTNKDGFYSMVINESGKSLLRVRYGGQYARTTLTLNHDKTVFNLELVKGTDGKYQLRQR